MALIKSANVPVSAQPFSLKDIENQARAILARARQQAEQFLAAAQVEAEEMKKHAYAQGIAEGRADGLRQGREEGLKAGREQALAQQQPALAAAVTALRTAAEQINSARLALQADALQDVINLAIAIAERVARRRGELDPAVALANVEEALKLVVHASDVRIAIHPTQKKTLEEALPRLRLEWPNLQHVELVEDPSLTPGGCRLFTAQGRVDGDLEMQLERIVADLIPGQTEASA